MPILDIGVHRALPYLVMPWLEGASLRTVLMREGKLSLPRAIKIATQIAEGLEFAHQLEILHRDIKPDNLWITPGDNVKLLDFGLARDSEEATPITHAGTVLGTPSYMSPEQIMGKSVDGRSDLFSLGVVLVEMLTGQSPFRKDNLFSTLMSVASDAVDLDQLDPEHQIPPSVCRLIQQLLHKNPDHRPASAAATVQAFRALANVSETGSLTPGACPTTSGSGRRTWTFALAALLGGFFPGLAAFTLWNIHDKGTLTVEATDPQVEVRALAESVTVRDLMTDRTYEIRIGATPLPSGVYQLELTDASRDLTFSSQTITIRRGAQTIVRVGLQPPAASIASQAPSSSSSGTETESAADSRKTFIPPLEPVPTDQIVDKSWDPEARERFAKSLPTLPALPLAEHFPVDRLGYSVTVPRPAKLPGIDAWSLEVPETPFQKASWRANADQTLFANGGNQLWIFDGSGTPRYLLPLPGTLHWYVFDNRHPNLIAVSSWEGKPKVGKIYEPGQQVEERKYRIHVWRLGPSGAELIQSLPCSSNALVWDQGYRLIYMKDNHVVATRLDIGTTTILADLPSNDISSCRLSPQGRFLVIRKFSLSEPADIIDLHRGKLVASVHVGGSVQWHKDDEAVAFFSPQNDFLEIWRPDRPEMIKHIPLNLPETNSQQTNKSTIASQPALNRDFSLLAQRGPHGELIVRSISSQREMRLTVESLRQLSYCTLTWNNDGTLSIRGDSKAFLWRPVNSELEGTLSIDTPPVIPPVRNSWFNENLVACADGKLLLRQSQPESDLRTNVPQTRGPMGDTSLAIINISDLDALANSPSKIRQEVFTYYHSLSPNGRWVVTLRKLSEDVVQLELMQLNDHRGIRIADFGSASYLINLNRSGLGRDEYASSNFTGSSPKSRESSFDVRWTNDSRYVLFFGKMMGQASPNGHLNISQCARLWDTETGEEVFSSGIQAVSPLFLSPNRVEAAEDGFLMQFDKSASHRLFFLQPKDFQHIPIFIDEMQVEHWKLRYSSGKSIIFTDSSLGGSEMVSR